MWVALKIGANGEVTEAKATRWQLTIDHSIDDPNYWASKPERAFVDAAEATALKWKFAPPEANTRTQVDVLFTFRNFPSAHLRRAKAVRIGAGIRPPTKVSDARPCIPKLQSRRDVSRDPSFWNCGSARTARSSMPASFSRSRCWTMLPSRLSRQWQYVPTLLNGAPVEVLVTVTINFVAPPAPLIRVERYRRRILAERLARPPRAGCAAGCRIGHSISVQRAAHVSRRMAGEGILRQQRQDVGRSLEQSHAEASIPRRLLVSFQRGKPHLPVEPRLVRGDPGRTPRARRPACT